MKSLLVCIMHVFVLLVPHCLAMQNPEFSGGAHIEALSPDYVIVTRGRERFTLRHIHGYALVPQGVDEHMVKIYPEDSEVAQAFHQAYAKAIKPDERALIENIKERIRIGLFSQITFKWDTFSFYPGNSDEQHLPFFLSKHLCLIRVIKYKDDYSVIFKESWKGKCSIVNLEFSKAARAELYRMLEAATDNLIVEEKESVTFFRPRSICSVEKGAG